MNEKGQYTIQRKTLPSNSKVLVAVMSGEVAAMLSVAAVVVRVVVVLVVILAFGVAVTMVVAVIIPVEVPANNGNNHSGEW